MSVRRCPYCGEPADHAACAGLFREVMSTSPAPSVEDLPADVAPHAADPGRLARQYVLVEAVGRGGMGVVWKAWDRRLARWTALKFLHGLPLAADAARFEREARLAAKLHHPNIASVLEFGETDDGRRFLAMAYIEGPPLSSATLPPREAAAVFSKVARAVDAAHRAGVIHRDLKPGNILLSREGWPYVTDFGLARTLDAPGSLTGSGHILGTPAFMAPEQADGKEADVRSDVYALGASLYATLARRAPFDGETALAILAKVRTEDPAPLPGVPPELAAIVSRAMSKAPEKRPASAVAFAEELDRFLADRAPRRSLLPGALAALALAAFAAWLLRPRPELPPPPAPLQKPSSAASEAPASKAVASEGKPGAAEREAEKDVEARGAKGDPPELERIDLSACARAADPEREFERVERELLALRPAGREGRRKRLTLLVAAGAQRRLLAGMSEADAARDLAAQGRELAELGGPVDADAWGPRLDDTTIKSLAVYVHSLGGGEK